MRTLGEIIDIIKDGGSVDYEELRYAVCALESLLTFNSLALMRLSEAEKNNQKPILTGSAVWQFGENFRRNKAAMSKSPKEWVGWNNDPDNIEFVKRRETSKRIADKLLNPQ